jgi:HPt (histidine-containing phosphotransfer) domain-containing protein
MHSLKGAAGQLGLKAIAADAARIEAILKQGALGPGDSQTISDMLARLNLALRELSQALAAAALA